MSILDDRQQIAALDKSNVLGSIEQLPDQILQAWQESSRVQFTFPTDIRHVVIAGMGGSALGARVIKSLYANKLAIPFEFICDYSLPAYVGADTLVILSSYSGTTEETLAVAQTAQAKQAQIAVITSGGDLLQLAQNQHYPHYQIKADHNPSNQPRMAIGYMIVGTLGLLHAANLIKLDEAELTATVEFLKQNSLNLRPESAVADIKKLAQDLQNDFIILLSAEFLVGATHVVNNQTNENAKHLTADFALPELNHHYLEALSFPQTALTNHSFLLIQSSLYSPSLITRFKITQKLLDEKGYLTHAINLFAPTPLTQVFELIQTGSYLAFYLSLLHGLDPAPIPSFDYFKAELKKTHENS